MGDIIEALERELEDYGVMTEESAPDEPQYHIYELGKYCREHKCQSYELDEDTRKQFRTNNIMPS